MPDLSGATLADVSDLGATGSSGSSTGDQVVDLSKLKPDMVNQDPNIFAALTAENARKTLSTDPSLGLTGDDVKGFYSKALEAANEYHRNLAQQQEQANVELQKRTAAVQGGLLGAEEATKLQQKNLAEQVQQLWQLTPQTALSGESPLTLQKKEEAGVDIQKQLQLEQAKEGPEAVAAAKEAGLTGQAVLHAPPDAIITKLEGIENGYTKLNDLQDLHTQATNTAAFGGFLKSKIGGLLTQPGIISEQVKNYKAAQHAAITPLAIGLLGDTARAATMPGQQENMLHNIIPDDDDNLQQAGNKIFMMKRNMIQQVQSLYDNNQGKYDMTRVNALLAKLHSDYDSDAVQQYDPYSRKNQSAVEAGSGSQTANEQIRRAASQNVQTNQTGSPTPNWAQGGMPPLPQLGGGASGGW